MENSNSLVPVNPGPRGPPTGPPRDPPRKPWEPCKTFGKTMVSRGIRLAPGGRPPAARAGSLDRQRFPRKPLKTMASSNSLVPANGCDCSRDAAPHARRSHPGVPGPATVTSKTCKNQWENSNSLVPVTGCDCSRDPAPHARRSHPGAPGPATVTSKTFKNQWENSNSLVPVNGCDCSRDPAPHARRSHPNARASAAARARSRHCAPVPDPAPALRPNTA